MSTRYHRAARGLGSRAVGITLIRKVERIASQNPIPRWNIVKGDQVFFVFKLKNINRIYIIFNSIQVFVNAGCEKVNYNLQIFNFIEFCS